MSREIKFRTLYLGTRLVYSYNMGNENQLASFFSCYVDAPETLMQYTGFKDSDGKEIYEGDLIRFYDKFLYEVRYEDAKFVCYNRSRGMDCYKWGNLHRFFDPDFKGYDIQIIGNIYENPELLKNDETYDSK